MVFLPKNPRDGFNNSCLIKVYSFSSVFLENFANFYYVYACRAPDIYCLSQ